VRAAAGKGLPALPSFHPSLTQYAPKTTRMHISKAEQLRRFKERQATDFKRYKITDEDWRNRKKWDAYKEAINDMVAHTSTEFAPWTVVPGNDKHFARVRILKTLSEALERLL